MTQPATADARRHSSDLAALVAAFVLVVGFTFSDDAVEFLFDVSGHPHSPARPWLVFALDCLLVVGTAALKWRISGGGDLRSFLRRLVRGWWGVGAALVVAGHLVLLATAQQREELGDAGSLWVNLLASLVFVTALTMLLLSALGEGRASRSWIVPFVFGSVVVHVATVLWYPVIDVEKGCAGDVSSVYFSDMANILAVMLLALGLEMNFVRRSATARDPGQRVAPVFTVVLMCVALGLTFTMLVKADLGPLCGLGAVWHEYISFVVTAQALAISLATMVWLLVVDAVQER